MCNCALWRVGVQRAYSVAVTSVTSFFADRVPWCVQHPCLYLICMWCARVCEYSCAYMLLRRSCAVVCACVRVRVSCASGILSGRRHDIKNNNVLCRDDEAKRKSGGCVRARVQAYMCMCALLGRALAISSGCAPDVKKLLEAVLTKQYVTVIHWLRLRTCAASI